MNKQELRQQMRETPAGKLLVRYGFEPYDTESSARRVADKAVVDMAALDATIAKLRINLDDACAEANYRLKYLAVVCSAFGVTMNEGEQASQFASRAAESIRLRLVQHDEEIANYEKRASAHWAERDALRHQATEANVRAVKAEAAIKSQTVISSLT